MSSVIQEIRRKFPLRAKTATPDEQETQTPSGVSVVEVPVDDIIPNRSQPRTTFNQNAILRLADSIGRYGVLQPLTVRKILVPSKKIQGKVDQDSDATYVPPNFEFTMKAEHDILYELVAGERRLRAAKIAGLKTVPCLVINTDDATSAELAIVENILREDLNMFEQAEAFRRLIDEFMLTQDEVARRVSLSQSAVANKLRILRLSREERKQILEAGLTERHARALLKITDECQRAPVLTHIVENKLNVSNTEAYIDSILDELSRIKREEQAKKEEMAEFIADNGELQEPTGNVVGFSKKKGAIRDIRLFYNSVRNAASILEQTGVTVKIDQIETEERIVMTLMIENINTGKPI